jgi:hypothetical protein
MRICTLILILLTIAVIPISADDVEDLLELVESKALKVNVKARVVDHGNVSVWDMEITKITISGKTVHIRLKGEDILVHANLTPYSENGQSILLVAQGQVWINAPGSDEVTYKSTVKSLPIRSGEKVLFYPLGVSSPEESDFFTIELEIEINHYIKQSSDQEK